MGLINRTPLVPTPRLPDAKVADIGKVRFGDGTITGEVPTPRLPDRKIADTGAVRLGDGTITGVYPFHL
jgi:hypothetical protein